MSGSGFTNDIMHAKNVDFSGGFPVTSKVTTNGQLLIGSTALPNIKVGNITSPLGTLSIGYSSPNITLDLSGGSVGIDSVAVQTGTSPVVPTAAGLLTLNGAVVAAGTNPIRTDGTGPNTIAVEVQTSQALAAADATKIGLSNFDSASFAVAPTGFVTLAGTGGAAIQTITGNTGGPEVPLAGNFNVLGTGSITVVGSANTETVQLTGLTANSVLYGLGTATIGLVASGTTGQVLQTNTGGAPTYSTATYPSTTTVSQILYSSATNVVSGLTTANSATLVTTSTGVPVFSSTMTNGQMIIGSTGATPTAGTITSTGGSITVTVGAGTLNLEVATGGFVWNDVSGAFSPLKENGYFITGTATGTLPAAPANGDTIKFFVDTTQILTIQATTGKIIRFGSLVSSAAGTFVSTLQGDSVELVYRSTNTCWCAVAGFTGTWTLT